MTTIARSMAHLVPGICRYEKGLAKRKYADQNEFSFLLSGTTWVDTRKIVNLNEIITRLV